MRADLSADGTLTITPESGTEAYALAAWLKAGKRGKHGCLAVAEYVAPTYDFKPGKIIPWPNSTGNDPQFLYPTITGLTLGSTTATGNGSTPADHRTWAGTSLAAQGMVDATPPLDRIINP